jgi:hypothetical protein
MKSNKFVCGLVASQGSKAKTNVYQTQFFLTVDSANQGFSTSDSQPVRFFHAENSAIQMFSIFRSRPMRFLGGEIQGILKFFLCNDYGSKLLTMKGFDNQYAN